MTLENEHQADAVHSDHAPLHHHHQSAPSFLRYVNALKSLWGSTRNTKSAVNKELILFSVFLTASFEENVTHVESLISRPIKKKPSSLIHIYASDHFKADFRFSQALWCALGMRGLSLRQIQVHIHLVAAAQSFINKAPVRSREELSKHTNPALMTLWAKSSKQQTWKYSQSTEYVCMRIPINHLTSLWFILRSWGGPPPLIWEPLDGNCAIKSR